MANTKNAIIRYRALDRCFSNRLVKYDINKLIEAVTRAVNDFEEGAGGVSRATVYADIAFMKSARGYNIDLDEDFKDGRTRYYRYTDPEFSINNLPLTETELNQLQTTVATLSQFKGLPQFDWLEEIIPKLKQGISTEQHNETIIGFDSNKYLKGIDHLGTLYNAIFYKRVLCIAYHPFEQGNASDITVHPYFLKQYNNRWFLFGHCPDHERTISTLALDRIAGIKELKKKYIPNKAVDWEEYFEDIVGVSKPPEGQVEKIELLVAPASAPYVMTKPLHGSQKKLKEDENGLLISLEVMVNMELTALILSFGERIKVVKPASFKNHIKAILRSAVKQYT